MVTGIRITGIPEVSAMLIMANEKTKLVAQAAIKQSGFFIKGEVVKSIAGKEAEPKSVDTGRFMNSVKTTFPKSMEAEVSSNVSYAKFLEYGTSKFQARHHFRNTTQRNTKKVRDFVNKKIKEII